MKSQITETERIELQEKIRAALPGYGTPFETAFERPHPELFLSADQGRMSIVYQAPHFPEQCPIENGVTMRVLACRGPVGSMPTKVHRLGTFKLN